jgi:hypothetical protein
MERPVAAKIVDILAAGRELGTLDAPSLKITDEQERRTF